MSTTNDRDYILGTHDEEVLRLGLQHRVWRPAVLQCWLKVGITIGKRVLDVGAGPGYATVDLAEIVGPTGEVVALERSHNFAQVMEERCRRLGLDHVRIHELDLMTGDLPNGPFDFTWCRWVASFVSDPALLVRKLAGVLPAGGVAIFHEYAHYTTWHFSPQRPHLGMFAQRVGESWRAAGGEPDIALNLPPLLAENGFNIRSATPLIFCLRPKDYMWQWPASFIDSGAARLRELGYVDEEFVTSVRNEFAEAEADENSLMLTPLVLEIIAEKR